MTKNLKISLAIVAAAVLAVGALVLFTRSGTPSAPAEQAGGPATAPASVLVRPDSHRLSTAADGKVTVLEFLDLECEGCGAAYPGVERLRKEYGDRVTFVIRYFPLPAHRNALLAARAVEAAGRQDKLEPMYRTMYETQATWGDQQVSHRGTFLGFARELGLDMAEFEKDLDAPAVTARVLKDRNDGISLGVQGTPTFFINGAGFTGAPTYQGLKAAIDAELAR